MPQLSGPVPDFAGLFAAPTIQRMLDELNDHEFEHFAAHVFEQAGYTVEDTAGQHGHGLDLKLYIGPAAARTLYAGVSVKHLAVDNLFHGQYMMNLRGAVNGKMQGYAVTTSKFNGPALVEARKEPQIWPIDGKHFVRYINYVRGSRAIEADDKEPDVRLRTNPLAPIPPEVLLAADDIVRRPQHQTKVLTLANHKGGVGKTTTALNLAFGLAALDQQVLLVDMDAQANLTKVLPSQARGAAPLYIGDYFTRKHPLPSLVRQTQFDRVWLIPSENALAHSDSGIAAGPGAELRFVRDLHAEGVMPPPALDGRPFDWIIIDTGPSMGFFTRSALAASHFVIMPVAPGAFSEEGLNFLRDTIATMEALTGASIMLLGSVITQWREDQASRQFVEPIEASLGIIGPKVPVDKNVDKAHLEAGAGKKRMLFSHNKSAAAKAYTAVVEEVRSRVIS